jgi:hypothetical protein
MIHLGCFPMWENRARSKVSTETFFATAAHNQYAHPPRFYASRRPSPRRGDHEVGFVSCFWSRSPSVRHLAVDQEEENVTGNCHGVR